MKTPTKRKYSWKRDNPDEEELIIAKCAAVMYRQEKSRCLRNNILRGCERRGMDLLRTDVFTHVNESGLSVQKGV